MLNFKYRLKRNAAQPNKNGGDTENQDRAATDADPVAEIVPSLGFPHRGLGLLDVDVNELPERCESLFEVGIIVFLLWGFSVFRKMGCDQAFGIPQQSFFFRRSGILPGFMQFSEEIAFHSRSEKGIARLNVGEQVNLHLLSQPDTL